MKQPRIAAIGAGIAVAYGAAAYLISAGQEKWGYGVGTCMYSGDIITILA